MTNRKIDVPSGLSEDEFMEFIREEVRKVGGDPDTLYYIGYGDEKDVDSLEPITIQVKYDYFNPTERSSDTASRLKTYDPLSKGVEITIIEDERDKNYRSAREVIDEWNKVIRESRNGLDTTK